MKKLDFNETELIGNWLVENGQARSDEVEIRIKWLTDSVLK